jgi:hypothetical protein
MRNGCVMAIENAEPSNAERSSIANWVGVGGGFEEVSGCVDDNDTGITS